MARKQSGHVFFSSPQLILQFTERVQWQLILQFTEGVQWFYYSKNCFSKDPVGVQHFPGGGGGFQMLISIETHITCDWGVTPSGSAHGAESPPPGKNSWIFALGVPQMTGE